MWRGGCFGLVGRFAEQLGDVRAVLLGLEDPVCNAHGENESLDLEDFRKSIYSLAHLFAELAEAGLHRYPSHRGVVTLTCVGPT